MHHPVEELKVRATLLHHEVEARTPAALSRLRALHEHRKATPEALSLAAADIQRKHCLTVVARETGFDTWDHAHAVLQGEIVADVGTLLCLRGSPAYWNIWSADHAEARTIQAAHGGWLLGYRRQFFIADQHYIAAIGLDPEDPDWARIDRDWARPREPAARTRLYARLLASTPRA